MAYSHEFAWTGSSGAHDMKSGPSYETAWRVFTDNPLDQAQRVILYVRANIVELGDEYQFANDNTGSIAIAKRIAPRRELGSTNIWIVTVTYEPYDQKNDDPGRDVDGVPTDNPIDWRPDIKCRTNRYSVPVEKARYLTGFTGRRAAQIASGSEHMPMNSVLIPFNPGIEREQVLIQVIINRKLAEFDATEATIYINDRPLNAVAFQIDWYGFKLRVLPREAKLSDFDLAFGRLNGYDYWDTTWGFEVKDSDWIDEILDRGIHASAEPGDPDGRGGTISAADIIPGVPQVRCLTDLDEMPITDPVPLNGDGQPLLPGQTEVWLSWIKYGEENFLTIPFFDGILIPL